METPVYQTLKVAILSVVTLSKDAIHIYIGLAVFFTGAIALKSPLDSLKALLPVLAIAFIMELLDFHDNLVSIGYFHWRASLHDMVNTVFWPLLLVLLAKTRLIRLS